jgi:hypothetical protein
VALAVEAIWNNTSGWYDASDNALILWPEICYIFVLFFFLVRCLDILLTARQHGDIFMIDNDATFSVQENYDRMLKVHSGLI